MNDLPSNKRIKTECQVPIVRNGQCIQINNSSEVITRDSGIGWKIKTLAIWITGKARISGLIPRTRCKKYPKETRKLSFHWRIKEFPRRRLCLTAKEKRIELYPKRTNIGNHWWNLRSWILRVVSKWRSSGRIIHFDINHFEKTLEEIIPLLVLVWKGQWNDWRIKKRSRASV